MTDHGYLIDILEQVIYPAIEGLGDGRTEQKAAELVLGTGLVESGYHDIVQDGGGPALGWFQMEPATHDSLWENWLGYRPEIANQVMHNGNVQPGRQGASLLTWNMRYAAAMCRIRYLRTPDMIPHTLEGYAAMWKKHYNTPLGAGRPQKFIDLWRRKGLAG